MNTLLQALPFVATAGACLVLVVVFIRDKDSPYNTQKKRNKR